MDLEQVLVSLTDEHEEVAWSVPAMVADLSPTGILIYRDNMFVFANPAAERISGYTQEEMSRMHFWDMVHPDYQHTVRERGTMRQEGQPVIQHYDFKIIHKQGKEKWVDLWGQSLPGKNSNSGVIIVQDKTKLVQAEQSLIDKESRYRDLVELLPNAVFEINLHRQISFINRQGGDLFGYAPQEMQQLSIYKLFAPEERHRLDRNIHAHMRGQELGKREYLACKRDGSYFPVEMYGSPISRKDQPIGFRGILSDITQRREYEDALERSEMRLSSIIEAISIPTFVINNEHIVTHWNAACERMTGITKENIIGTSDHSLPFYDSWRPTLADMVIDKVPIEQINASYPNLCTLSGSYQAQGYFPRLDKWLFFTVTPLSEDETGGTVETIQDITEQKNAALRTESMLEAIVRSQGRTAEIFDTDTGDHIKRIGAYCQKMAQLIGMDASYQKSIGLQAQLHDIGKVHVPYEILNKAKGLTEEEFEAIKEHTTYGAIILRGSPELALAKQIAHFHHEKYDGSGYPDGLVGEEIPLAARITAIADVFDALISRRVYKDAFSYDDALRIMIEGDNRLDPQDHFDPKLLKIFRDNYEEFIQIHKESINEAQQVNVDVLFVEDEVSLQEMFRDYFQNHSQVNIHQTYNRDVTLRSLKDGLRPQIAFIDINLPDGSGHEVARDMRSRYPDSYLVCTTGDQFVSESLLYDQILHKPYRLSKLGKIVELFARYR
ncbi:MAG: PAS domain S-box protein [Nanobdellota archaeon]